MSGVAHGGIPDNGEETQDTEWPLPAGTADGVTWSHQAVADLELYLVSPSGAELKLFDIGAGGNEGFTDKTTGFTDQGR